MSFVRFTYCVNRLRVGSLADEAPSRADKLSMNVTTKIRSFGNISLTTQSVI